MYKDKRTVGSISGWNVITTDDNSTGKTPLSDHDYTVVDLEIMLRGLKKMFNPKYLEKIENLINKHIQDKNNPHNTDLSKLHTDVLQELYKLWLSEGYAGTRDEFLKILFQYVQIASVEEALKGESYDKITSVKDVFEMVKKHDEDEDVHEELIKTICPGERLDFDPTFGVKAYIGFPYWGYEIKRDSKSWIINNSGFLEEIEKDEIKMDYILGRASIPVFDKYENLIENSEEFDNKKYYNTENCNVVKMENYTGIRKDEISVYTIQEKENNESVIHSLNYTKEILTEDDKYYTISLFVRPYGRDSVGIKVNEDAIGSIYNFIHFNLKENKIIYHEALENISGKIYPLYNGWYRISMTFRAVDGNVSINPKIYSLDIYDGDYIHSGKEGLGLAIFGLMISKSSKVTPYIPTENGVVSVAPTYLKFEINKDNWYNENEGTWVIEFDGHYNTILDITETLFTIADGVKNSVLISKYPPGYRDRIYFSSFDKDNQALTSIWCDPCEEDHQIAVYTYGEEYHLACTFNGIKKGIASKDINDKAGYIYLGSNRLGKELYNGYIYGFHYYPFKCNEGQLEYIRGKKWK